VSVPGAAGLRFQPEGEQPLLLNPGPVNVTRAVAEALLSGDLCHREPEYAALQAELRDLLVRAFAPGGGWEPVLLTGSGTAAMEAAVSSSLSPEGKLLVLQNGVYGERLARIAAAHRLPARVLEAGWTEPCDPAAVARALAEDPALEVVAAVHHETTTGLLNPVRELAAVVRDAGRTLVLDSISGLAGEELDVPGWGVDVVIGTANKCIRGIPGQAFCLVRREVICRIAAYPPRSLYLHLPTYQEEQAQGGVPFTPAVQVAFAFRAALRELLEEGVAERVARAGRTAARVRAGLEELGLELLLPPERRSRTITTVRLPAGWTYEALHDALRAEGFVIYAGQGPLRQEAFRVSNMGVLDDADYDRFLAVLGRALGRGGA